MRARAGPGDWTTRNGKTRNGERLASSLVASEPSCGIGNRREYDLCEHNGEGRARSQPLFAVRWTAWSAVFVTSVSWCAPDPEAPAALQMAAAASARVPHPRCR